MPVRRSMLALVGRKQTVVRDQVFPQKPHGLRLWFSRTGVQYSHGSSTIEVPSVFDEFGTYPPDRRELSGSPRPCSLPLASRHLPKGTKLELERGAHTWEHHPQPNIMPPPRLNRPAKSQRQPVGCIPRGWARPYTRRKDPPTLIPQNQVSEGEGTRSLRHVNYWLNFTYVRSHAFRCGSQNINNPGCVKNRTHDLRIASDLRVYHCPTRATS